MPDFNLTTAELAEAIAKGAGQIDGVETVLVKRLARSGN